MPQRMMLFHNQPSHACALYLAFLDESFHPIEENHKFYCSQYSMSIMNLSYVLCVNLSYSKYLRIQSPSRRKKGTKERNKGDKNNKYFCHRGTGEGQRSNTTLIRRRSLCCYLVMLNSAVEVLQTSLGEERTENTADWLHQARVNFLGVQTACDWCDLLFT